VDEGLGQLQAAVSGRRRCASLRAESKERAGATAIAQTGISGGEQAVALIVFILIASIGVAAPVVIYFALGERAGPLLERLKNWLAYNNTMIMAVLMVIIGVKLIGDAISGLSG
jgi:hypothetical protein